MQIGGFSWEACAVHDALEFVFRHRGAVPLCAGALFAGCVEHCAGGGRERRVADRVSVLGERGGVFFVAQDGGSLAPGHTNCRVGMYSSRPGCGPVSKRILIFPLRPTRSSSLTLSIGFSGPRVSR